MIFRCQKLSIKVEREQRGGLMNVVVVIVVVPLNIYNSKLLKVLLNWIIV